MQNFSKFYPGPKAATVDSTTDKTNDRWRSSHAHWPQFASSQTPGECEVRHRRLIKNLPESVYSSSNTVGGIFYSPRVEDRLATDITERKLMEEAIRENAKTVELLKRIADIAHKASAVGEVMQACLGLICGHTKWPVGHVYVFDEEAGDLYPTDIWHLDHPDRFETFRRLTEKTRFALGSGLPGRVLVDREPTWIIDVNKDSNFPRAKLAEDIGVKAGFAFPVLVGDEVVAVLEFFSEKAVEPNSMLLEVFGHVGIQLGLVIERTRAEEILRISEEKFHDFASAATDWFWEMGPELRFFSFSEQVGDRLGISNDMLIGKTRREVGQVGSNGDDWEAHLADLDAHRPFRDFEYEIEHGIFVSVSGIPVFDNGGKFLGYRGTGTNITDRKQAEDALKVAKEDAEKANQAKSEFLKSMSHELRTPLNAVLGFAQMLQFDPNAPLSLAQNEHIESILAGGNHLLELVNEILDLARIEADRLDLSLEKVNANEVVPDCIALINLIGNSRDITIIDRFSSGPASHLRTDRRRLKQVLFNLLSNAAKYNRNGGSVTMDGRETDGGFLRLSVTDTGIGISKEEHSKVFQMFHRLGADPMVAREGLGIGLAVSRHLIEKMAGRVGFKSEEDVGSTFWVELPLASNEEVLIWTDRLRVGVDAIDKDHQKIFSLANKVINGPVDEVDLDEVIEELINYTRYHFKREETIMEVCGYPDLEVHRDHHQKLIAQMTDLAETRSKERDPEHLSHLRKLLRDWLLGHIGKADTKISQYAKGMEPQIWKALQNFETLSGGILAGADHYTMIGGHHAEHSRVH